MENDRALLVRVRDGDQSALAQLHRSHRAVAHSVAYRVLRDHALAEDAVQEGFLDLWRTAEGFDPRRAPVRAWLCVLVHRRAVDVSRREARARAAFARQEAQPHPESYTAEEVAVIRYDRRRVRAALRQLTAGQRTLLEQSYWGGVTQQQLAERLGLPLGTVKSRTYEALRRLRLELDAA